MERVEEEARHLFPEARIAVFSSDTVFDAREARRLVEAMAAGEIDILVATQAAAKGHNFPKLTLVGVVDADLGLRGGDLRAAERTYQLLAQATALSSSRRQSFGIGTSCTGMILSRFVIDRTSRTSGDGL